MPFIKELEDLMPLVSDMDEEHQKRAARELRRIIIMDDYCKGMSQEETIQMILLDLTARKAKREAEKRQGGP